MRFHARTASSYWVRMSYMRHILMAVKVSHSYYSRGEQKAFTNFSCLSSPPFQPLTRPPDLLNWKPPAVDRNRSGARAARCGLPTAPVKKRPVKAPRQNNRIETRCTTPTAPFLKNSSLLTGPMPPNLRDRVRTQAAARHLLSRIAANLSELRSRQYQRRRQPVKVNCVIGCSCSQPVGCENTRAYLPPRGASLVQSSLLHFP
jgi:hypothetical protein